MTGMCSPSEYYRITVPPPYELLEDETFPAFPPPTSPLVAQLPCQWPVASGDSNLLEGAVDVSEADQKIGGVLLSQMEEEPMARSTAAPAQMDVDKLLSPDGISSLWHVLRNKSFKGIGHEVEDLQKLLEEIQQWAQCLYPHLAFEDLVTQFKDLGNNSAVQVCIRGLQMRPLANCSLPESTVLEQACEWPLLSDAEEGWGTGLEPSLKCRNSI
ncbi:TIMELESS-interacting protein-like isoform X2 [Denticeps clupeoides]|uniref:TIMELESS-interacting protein-like isoform X2 n=1 Tax=Denticeps clupeoides TaxID=299321 RepID=UPI0010A36CAE|nr:TIMELESS-interacting protein-like isoform X2 [Denticeps clupeoides]